MLNNKNINTESLAVTIRPEDIEAMEASIRSDVTHGLVNQESADDAIRFAEDIKQQFQSTNNKRMIGWK